MRTSALVIALLAATAVAPAAHAKCFGFRGKDIKVCVDGNDNAARRQAEEVCEQVTGSDCSISGYSGSCRKSSSVTCYDENGEEQRSIDSDVSATNPSRDDV